MKVLGIDTSGSVGSIAVCDGDTTVGTKTFERASKHGREIVSSLEIVFNTIKWKPEEIELIAVSTGPGSYTGLRVGITCAKTLAYGLGKPVIDVPTLDVLAMNTESDIKNLCPIIDAKRKMVYACIYKRSKHRDERITDFLIIEPHDLVALLPESTLVFGDGLGPYKEIFTQNSVLIMEDENLCVTDAGSVARLGLKRYEMGERCEINSLVPLYLRRSEAEEKAEKCP